MDRRQALLGGAGLAALGATQANAQTIDLHWLAQAALLDPRAYAFKSGTNWTLTVPEDEIWYSLNHFKLLTPGGFHWYHRTLDATNPAALPAGTVLEAGPEHGFIYYCRPALIYNDVRYSTDPEGLYYDRLTRLMGFPMSFLGASHPQGTPASQGVLGAIFPTDFEWGMIRHISNHDIAWTILAGSNWVDPSVLKVMNTTVEISDWHMQRETLATMCPFRRIDDLGRTEWNGIQVAKGNELGNGDKVTERRGDGVLAYQELPLDW